MHLHPKTLTALRYRYTHTLHRLPGGRFWIELHRLACVNTRRPDFRREGGIHRDYLTNRTYGTQEYYDGEPVCTVDGELVTFDTRHAASRWIDGIPQDLLPQYPMDRPL